MKVKKWLGLSVLLMMFFILGACGAAKEAPENLMNSEEKAPADAVNTETEFIALEDNDVFYPMIFTDSEGREIEFDEKPERIISLSATVTEIMVALDGTLIGRTSYCNYPESVLELPEIGSLREPDIEKIIELAPDLVVGSSLTAPETMEQLEDNGIRVIRISDKKSFDGIYTTLIEAAFFLNSEVKAAEITDDIKKTLDIVAERTNSLKRKPTVYYMIGAGEGGDYTATGDTFIHTMLSMAGGDNIASEGVNYAFSIEELLEKDPEIIIVSDMIEYNLKELLPTMEIYKELSAVKNGHIYEVNADLVDRAGPRIGEGVMAFSDIIEAYVYE